MGREIMGCPPRTKPELRLFVLKHANQAGPLGANSHQCGIHPNSGEGTTHSTVHRDSPPPKFLTARQAITSAISLQFPNKRARGSLPSGPEESALEEHATKSKQTPHGQGCNHCHPGVQIEPAPPKHHAETWGLGQAPPPLLYIPLPECCVLRSAHTHTAESVEAPPVPPALKSSSGQTTLFAWAGGQPHHKCVCTLN